MQRKANVSPEGTQSFAKLYLAEIDIIPSQRGLFAETS